MFRVRRRKLSLVAAAVGASLPAWGYAQNATWTYNGNDGLGGPWVATWTDNIVGKPWVPNNTFPNSGSAIPLFPSAIFNAGNGIPTTNYSTNGRVTVELNQTVTVNSLVFYTQTGGNNLPPGATAAAEAGNVGYYFREPLAGPQTGVLTIQPSSGTNAATIDIGNIGRDTAPPGGFPSTPFTVPGIATIATSIVQSSGVLAKVGVGTLVLSGSNNFAGAEQLSVQAGVVRILDSHSLDGLQIVATLGTGAVEFYNNAGNISTTGTVTFGGLGSGTPSSNGVMSAMGGSNSTWGGSGSLFMLLNKASLGAAASSTLTINSTIVDVSPNSTGLVKEGNGVVITSGLQLNNGPLTINDPGAGTSKLRIAPVTGNTNANLSTVKGLTIAGGTVPTATLDLTNNDMIVDYTGSTSPVAIIRKQLKVGRNAGLWNGTAGILSSYATSSGNGAGAPGAGNDVSERGITTALGWVDNAYLGNASPRTPLTTFDGVSIPTTSVLIKYTWPGDSDLNGSVDGNDLSKWLANFTGGLGPQTDPRPWFDGDWNYDGSIDGNDSALWLSHFTGGLGGGGLAPVLTNVAPDTNPQAIAILEGMGIAVQLVPEPATLSAMAIGLGSLIMRRRRRA